MHTPSLSHSQTAYTSIPNINHHNSFLLEHQSPSISHEHQLLPSPQFPTYRSSNQSQYSQTQSAYVPAPNPFPQFEPSVEQHAPTVIPVHPQSQFHPSSLLPRSSNLQQSYYTAIPHTIPQTTRREEPRRVSSTSWHQVQAPTPSEWLRPEETRPMVNFGNNISIVGGDRTELTNGVEDSLRSSPPRFSFSQQSPPGHVLPSLPSAPSHTHEVGLSCPNDANCRLTYILFPSFSRLAANQLSFSFASVILSSLSCLRESYHQVLGSTSFHISSTEAQSCRGRGTC